MIVVDTNVLVYLFVAGPKTQLARLLLERDPAWLLPPLWRHEFHNVMATHVQTKRLSPSQATLLWQQALDLLGDSERDVDMTQALDIAFGSKISGYDAQFLALADAHGTVCVSEDKALKAKAKEGLVKNLDEMLP